MSKKDQNAPDGSTDLVVVGSSAGGVEALSILVSSLLPDFPTPIVLAQHLDPKRPSMLHTILQKRTKLAVEIAASRTRLQPGHIYVVPANQHIAIRDQHIEIREDKQKRPRPSVDTLLSTAALSYGEHLIAVILTGSGSDGATGAIDVKNAGGTVIVQDPKTARYPAMPLALPPTVIDFETNIEHMGALLYDLVTGMPIPPAEEKTENVLNEILEIVSRQASIDFHPYKKSTILRRISRRMVVTHQHTIRDYADFLKTSPYEVGELVKAFLINVTQFFRDAEAFAYLKNNILPQLIERARERDRILRFWTAGCATGEEPYSLAMLLTDSLGAELPEWSIKIFATDVGESVINFARRGIYSENLLKGIPEDYQERFFERVDHSYRIAKTLRQMVIFGQQDLSRSAPFPRIDLVLCRNVLIYFTPELQDYVLHQFAFSLTPHGYLFLGKAETVRPMQSFFELVNKHWKVYRCIGNVLPSVRRQTLSTIPTLEGHIVHRQSRSITESTSHQEQPSTSLELSQLRRFNELLFRFLPVGVVVINRTYHILTSNGAARRLLGLRDVGSEQDFLHAVRGIPYHETRTTIDSVFRERNSLTLPDIELDTATGGSGRFISVTVSLIQLEVGGPDLAAISITDVTQQIQVNRQLETIKSEQTQLMSELGTANKRLSDVNKELMDANEELQVANEELVLTHEELQASIEEFETTNEELQATNEELETNNEELQATNEELETTNEELRARTSELQELTSILESERGRLSEMVELAPFYILLLRGPNLLVEAYNPRYARLLENRAVQGRPLDEVIDLFWENGMEIVHIARDAYRLDQVYTTPRILNYFPNGSDVGGKKAENYFTYTVVPSHDTEGKVDGVIIYAVDETEQRLCEVDEERAQLKLIFNNFPVAAMALFDAPTASMIIGSPRYLEMAAHIHHLPHDDLVGRTWFELTLVPSSDQAKEMWREVIEQHQTIRIPEMLYQDNNTNTTTVWDYTLTPLMDTEYPSLIRFVLVTAIEVTEQVQARKELEELDNLKDEFVSLVAHELRSPLTAIKTNAQLAHRYLSKDAQMQQERSDKQLTQMQTKIVHQVDHITRLIEEILDVTRLRGNIFALVKSEGVDIVELMRQVIEQYTMQGQKIEFHSSEQSCLGTFDEGRIEQVFTNLLTNAIKYNPADKPITVTLTRQSGKEAEEVLISVQDFGPGIAASEQAHIFERFYRASNQKRRSNGLGLGLYITHEIVKLHGGRIWVESELGKGSTFFVALPVQA